MRAIRIYVEGGGVGRSSWRPIRAGFQKFLNPLRQQHIEVILGGSKRETLKDFKRGLKQHPNAINVLLVDSDDVVVLPRWEHLRRQTGWEDIPSLPEVQCHFMVQVVEAWLIADPDALVRYYGSNFRRNALPRHGDVEAVPKEELLRKLGHATAGTPKRGYNKTRHCADLLHLLDHDRVRHRARHCGLLFEALESQSSE